MRAFIVGATGYTGTALVRLLRQQGHDVIAHIRPGSPSGDVASEGFEALGAVVDRTAWVDAEMAAAIVVHQPTHVFAVLGTTAAKARAAAKRGEVADYETVDLGMTMMAYRGAEAVSPAPVFAYLSSLGTDGKVRNAYLEARYKVEAALKAGSLPWISVRPAFITGPGRAERRAAESIGAVVADAGLGMLGAIGARRLRDQYLSIDSDGLAKVMIDLASDPAALGRSWEPADYRGRP